MKVLIIDNYDSFTYNLVQLIREIGVEQLDVIRNDKTTLDEIGHYDKYIISPGPGVPSEAPLLGEIIEHFGPTKSILGICLGHQAIGESYGSRLINLKEVYHGVATDIQLVQQDYLFEKLPKRFAAGRYHSWAVAKESLSENLDIIATDDQGAIMALRHREYDVRGMQFHPESILTECGKQMLQNFINYSPNIQNIPIPARGQTKANTSR